MGHEELGKDELITLLYILLHLGEGGVAVIEAAELERAGVEADVEAVLKSLESRGLVKVVKVERGDLLNQLSLIIENIEAIVLGSQPGWEWGRYLSKVLELYNERNTLLRKYVSDGDVGDLIKASEIDAAISPYRLILTAGDLIKPLKKKLITPRDCLQYEKTVLYLLPLIGRESVIEPLSYDLIIESDNVSELIEKEGLRLYVIEEDAINSRIKELLEWMNVVEEAIKSGGPAEALTALAAGLRTDISILKRAILR